MKFVRKRNPEAGFSLMEVLVATFILALVIMTINLACKQFFTMQAKMQRMETIYLSALSLKDRLASSPLEGGMTEAGTFNGLEYGYTVHRLAQKNNYLQGTGPQQGGKNPGSFSLQLLRVELQLAGRNYEFLTTRVE